MTAQVIAIRTSSASSTGWSSQELAEVFRLGDMLHRHGVDLAISYGVSDEGDPWLVLSDPLDAEISFHIARIDQSYVIARGDSDEVTVKRHMREVAEVLVPSRASQNLVFGSENEPLELYAVVALAIASSESFAQAPALKQALEAAALGERDSAGRETQRDSEDRISELARILIAAANAGESDAGRAALAMPLLPSLAPALPAQAASQAAQPGAQTASRAALTVSVELGQAIAPGQRDLALTHGQSMIAGLAAGTSANANLLDSHQDSSGLALAAAPLTVSASATPLPELGQTLIKIAASAFGAAPEAAVSAPGQLGLPMPTPDILVAIENGAAARDMAGVPVGAGRTIEVVQAQAQTFDFSADKVGVRVTVADSTATIVGSHGFDLITVNGHNLVRIGDGGALVTIASGDNIIIGSSAVSTVNISGGNNSVAGGAGTQTVNIQDGHNTVTGGSGTQVVNIAGGSNTVVGGSGGTVVNVGAGINSITGGSGTDTINVHDGVNTVTGGSGGSIINIAGGTTTVNPGAGHDSISIGPGASIVGTAGASPIIGSTAGTQVPVSDAGSNVGLSLVGSAATHDPTVATA